MKARGEWDKYGRPQLVSEKQFAIAYQAVEEKKITAVECMNQLGVGKTTFYKLRKQYLESKNKQYIYKGQGASTWLSTFLHCRNCKLSIHVVMYG